MKYLIIDTLNMLMRAKHVVRGDAFLKSGMALHITLNSVRSAMQKFDADHVVFCLEGRSWRKDYYPRYKANRTAIRIAKSIDEQEEDQIFFELVDKFAKFLEEKTNCTVLRHEKCEADDFVARWIQRHNETIVDKANNHFVIISSDSDFQQLIDTNVEIYDGISQKYYRHTGIFNEKGDFFKDKKGTPLQVPDPEWLLFEKCIRGDTSDNVLSAYPGVREHGTKKKIGMREAFDDRNSKGYNWNNFMLQSWIDHNSEEQLVKDRYEENKQLIDLSCQPQEIKDALDQVIDKAKEENKHIPMIGAHFLKLCGIYDLQKISENPNPYVKFLSASLNKN